MIIYKITNKINQKKYIGYDTSDDFSRWRRHQTSGDRNLPLKTEKYSYLYRAMRKYGIKNFIFDVIDSDKNIEGLKEKEIFWISYYNTYLGEGYNLTPGGDGGIGNQSFLDNATSKQLEEYKELLSKRTKDSWAAFSKDERQKRIDDSHRWINEMSEEEKIRHYEKTGAGVSKWRNSMTEEEKKEFNRKTGLGVKKHWENLSKQELIKRSKIRSKNVKSHWNNLTKEERKKRNKNSGRRNMYSVISPEGTVFEVKNMPSFCKENNLDYGSMWRISKSGKLHKEWRCEIISD